MRVALRKLDGVESVDVSLERATADVHLRAGNRVTLPQLRQIIRNNGFSTREATVTVVGTLIERGGRTALEVIGINTVWLLVAIPSQRAAYDSALKQLAAKQPGAVEMVGVVTAAAIGSDPETFAVSASRPAPR